jgi:hypothetical protein
MTYTIEGSDLAFAGLRRRDAVGWTHNEYEVCLSVPAGEAPFPAVIVVAPPGLSSEQFQTGYLLHRLPEAGFATVAFQPAEHTESDNQPMEDVLLEGLEVVCHWLHEQPEVDVDHIGIAACGACGVVVARAVRRHLVRPAAVVLLGPSVEPCGFVGIHIPSLVIVGAADEFLPAVRTAADHSETAFVTLVSGAGHEFDTRYTLQESSQLAADWFTSQFGCEENHLQDPDIGVGD